MPLFLDSNRVKLESKFHLYVKAHFSYFLFIHALTLPITVKTYHNNKNDSLSIGHLLDANYYMRPWGESGNNDTKA